MPAPCVAKMQMVVDGFAVFATGIAATAQEAAAKARAELVERIYSSDLANTDVTGLFTYKQPTQWCSTGAAAHPNRDQAFKHSTMELIERDAVACWLALSRQFILLDTREQVALWAIPCAYEGVSVVVAVRHEGNRTQLTGAAAATVAQASDRAWLESFVRLTLPEDFDAKRLPAFTKAQSLPTGALPIPELNLREWQVDDLFVVKQFSSEMADLRRGIPAAAVESYRSYLGQICPTYQLQRNWYS